MCINYCNFFFLFIWYELIFAAQTEKECEAWVKGLQYLIEEAKSLSYPLQIETWLRKEFYAIQNADEL